MEATGLWACVYRYNSEAVAPGWWKVIEQIPFLKVPDYILVGLLLTTSISHFYIPP